MFFPALAPSSLAGLNTARASSTCFGPVSPEVPGSPFPGDAGCLTLAWAEWRCLSWLPALFSGWPAACAGGSWRAGWGLHRW